MNQSQSTEALFTAIAAAQAEFQHAKQSGRNKHLNREYSTLTDIRDACIPVLAKHGVAVVQPPVVVEGKLYVRTVIAKGAESVSFDWPLVIAKDDAQGIAAALKYARRQALASFFCVPETEADDDGSTGWTNGDPWSPQNQQKKPLTNHAPKAAAQPAPRPTQPPKGGTDAK